MRASKIGALRPCAWSLCRGTVALTHRLALDRENAVELYETEINIESVVKSKDPDDAWMALARVDRNLRMLNSSLELKLKFKVRNAGKMLQQLTTVIYIHLQLYCVL